MNNDIFVRDGLFAKQRLQAFSKNMSRSGDKGGWECIFFDKGEGDLGKKGFCMTKGGKT